MAPSLTWKPSSDTKLTVMAEYDNLITVNLFGFPQEGTILKTKYGKIPRDQFQGVPGFDNYDSEHINFGYEFSHYFTPQLQFQHKLRKVKTDLHFPFTLVKSSINADNRIYSRSAIDRDDEYEVLTGSMSAKYDWYLGDNIDNVSLFGIDYSNDTWETERYGGTASNIDVYDPDRNTDSVSNFKPLYPWSFIIDTKQQGVFAQNQLTYNEKWVGMVGIRHSKVDIESKLFFTPNASQQADNSATVGRGGLVYLMDNGLAPFASITLSFEPQSGKSRNGNLFEPTEGLQYEVGVRYQPDGMDTLLTGSLYRIDQTNVLVADPQSPYNQIQQGEVRSQGLELEAKTQLGDNAHLIAAYAYTDARTTKASPLYPNNVGKRQIMVPYNKFSVWGDYRFADFGMPKLKAGLGLTYTGETTNNLDENNPEYTLIDAMASYDWSDNLKLSLNVKNLLDEEYALCGYSTCNYGEPRNVVGKMTYKW